MRRRRVSGVVASLAMGRQSGVTTTAAILRAFESRARWRQAELARHVGVKVPALRRHLAELVDVLPLSDVRDGSDVFWSLPRGWTAEGARISMDTLERLIRLLARSPASKLRDEALALLLQRHPQHPRPDRVEAPELSAEEERVLPLLEDALARRTVLGMTYFSASSGRLRQRNVTPARVLLGPPVRFVAFCHLERELRWFRADNVQTLWLEPSEKARAIDPAEVDAFVRRGVNGYAAADGRDDSLALFVRDPEAAWVKRNLLRGMTAQDVPGGIRVVAGGPGLLPFARFAVGLGAAAEPESRALAEAMRELAEGALRAVAARGRDGRAAVEGGRRRS